MSKEVRIEAIHAACALMANVQESRKDKLALQVMSLAKEFTDFIETGEVPQNSTTHDLNLVYRGSHRPSENRTLRAAS